ncbi:hypothetical protein [Vibrio jasicida]|uniref:hypothetical protein n=1 Tax=Vibrio jasicida TaxID=766224 RepID=UPI0005EEEC2D|nr:hypothetical protein [Vibrio jasicida]
MATEEQKQEFKRLVKKSGSYNKASLAIKSIKTGGYAPTKSGIAKVYKDERNPEPYVMQTYIDDLTKALEEQNNEK